MQRQRLPRVMIGLLLPLLALLIWQWSLPVQGQAEPTPSAQIFLPDIAVAPSPTATPTASRTPTPTPSPTASSTTVPNPGPDVWDPRLDQRFAVLVRATVQPGQGYWHLARGVWFDTTDERPMGVGDHDIAFDVQNASGQRKVGTRLTISWPNDGLCATVLRGRTMGIWDLPLNICYNYVETQAKPGEAYAGSYPMYHVAPTYRIQVDDGYPSDAVDGLGMGSIQDPYHKVHTSYGFTWRWTIAPNNQASPTATRTNSPTATRTAPATPTATATPSPTPTASPTSGTTLGTPTPTSTPTPSPTRTATYPATATATPTPSPGPGLIWDPRLTQRGVVIVPASVQPGLGYWRLARGTWYPLSDNTCADRGLILFDTVSASGQRLTNVPLGVTNLTGDLLQSFISEAKPGEPYAANFPMWQPAPAYIAGPRTNTGLDPSADRVANMGRGTLTDPAGMEPTCYGFVWQWTIAGASGH